MSAEPYEPLERRPIASRELKLSRLAARWLASVGVSPNAISSASMLAAILAGGALAATSTAPATWGRVAWIGAAVFVQLRLVANLLDGMVAMESKRASPLGELYNEIPDRVSDAAILVGMGYATGSHATLGYVAACVAIFTAYVRAMGKVAGAPQEYCGPMAKPHRMFVVTLIALYCGLAPQSWQPAWQAFSNEAPPLQLPAAGLAVIVVGGLFTAVRRLRRAAAALSGREHKAP